MKIFLDESGNTGVDLLNKDQPVFALAATSLDSEDCISLISPLLAQSRTEAKYSRLKGNNRGRRELLKFFCSDMLSPSTTKFQVADKRFYLVSHLVDKLIEPLLHESGIDLYAGDAHVGLANVWYYAGHTIFPNGMWDKVLRSFLLAIRSRTRPAFARFDAVLTESWRTAPEDSRDYAAGLYMARGRLNEFIGVFKDVEVFDPAVDLFVSMVNQWMATESSWLDVTHDRSKPLRRSEKFLRVLMTPTATRQVGYGNRKAELPLRVSNLSFGDSKQHPQLQVADIIAGASIDCLLVWSGRRPSTEYHDAMKETRLADLFCSGMLPSPDIKRENESQKGEQSIVDGTTNFLRDVGYFEKT